MNLADIKRLALLSQYMLFSEDEPDNGRDPIRDTITNFLPWYGSVSKISHRMDGASIEIDRLFDQTEPDFHRAPNLEQLVRLRKFLSSTDLRESIREASNDLTRIQDFIKENFSIVDIMLDVGAEQLKQRPLI